MRILTEIAQINFPKTLEINKGFQSADRHQFKENGRTRGRRFGGVFYYSIPATQTPRYLVNQPPTITANTRKHLAVIEGDKIDQSIPKSPLPENYPPGRSGSSLQRSFSEPVIS